MTTIVYYIKDYKMSTLNQLHSIDCVPAGSTLCRECVSQRCRVLRLKNQLNEDYREVTNLVKRTLR